MEAKASEIDFARLAALIAFARFPKHVGVTERATLAAIGTGKLKVDGCRCTSIGKFLHRLLGQRHDFFSRPVIEWVSRRFHLVDPIEPAASFRHGVA